MKPDKIKYQKMTQIQDKLGSFKSNLLKIKNRIGFILMKNSLLIKAYGIIKQH